jgi:hypothetical protein
MYCLLFDDNPTFGFEINKILSYLIDGKHVRVYHSRIFKQTSFFCDGDFQIWSLKVWSLARLTSAKNHILQSTYSK